MGTVFEFDSALAKGMEMLYRTEDAARRRQVVLELLRPGPGERVLDIGTGPGFLAAEMAPALGATGHVLGIDTSDPMLQLARQRCASMPWVEFQHADASSLPLQDAAFDAAVSVQVFEYIADVDRALAEMHRVLRPGGRGVVVSTDWDMLAWHSSDPARMERVMRAFRAHCALPNLPRTLAARLKRAGFSVRDQQVILQFNPRLEPNRFSYHAIGIVQSFVAGRDSVTEAEARAWAEDLHALGARDEYFFCLNQFVFVVGKE
jgi:ubiquinone/menaquinone biosynthesis C-methylase UbiE